MADITTMKLGEYKRRLPNDNGPCLVLLEIPAERGFAERGFELKGHIL